MTNLATFRKSKMLTQKQMATKIGVSESYYAMIEIELRNPSYNFISKFIQAFPEVEAGAFFLNKNFTKREVE